VEQCPIGVHTGHWGYSFMEGYEALRRDDPLEDSTGGTHRLVAANNETTFAAIRIYNAQDREA
jgi:hypothetical protein